MGEKKFCTICYHVVCLIDVLGQKDKLKGWADPPLQLPPPREYIQAIGKTLGNIRSLTKAFNMLFQAFDTSYMPQDEFASLPVEAQGAIRLTRETRLGIQQFADTFVFYAPTADSQGNLSLTAVLRMIQASCVAMQSSLATGMALRGSLCVGMGTEVASGTFYGPALVEAHHLESVAAIYPRIVVSQNLVKLIEQMQAAVPTKPVHDGLKVIASMCKALICQDIDGQYIVDFLGEGVREDLSRSAPAPLVEAAYTFVKGEASRFRESGDAKLALRYALLQQYIESRLSIWELGQDVRRDPSGVGGS